MCLSTAVSLVSVEVVLHCLWGLSLVSLGKTYLVNMLIKKLTVALYAAWLADHCCTLCNLVS